MWTAMILAMTLWITVAGGGGGGEVHHHGEAGRLQEQDQEEESSHSLQGILYSTVYTYLMPS